MYDIYTTHFLRYSDIVKNYDVTYDIIVLFDIIYDITSSCKSYHYCAIFLMILLMISYAYHAKSPMVSVSSYDLTHDFGYEMAL